MVFDLNRFPQHDHYHEIVEEINSNSSNLNHSLINFNVEAILGVEYPSMEVQVDNDSEEVSIEEDEEEVRGETQADVGQEEMTNVNHSTCETQADVAQEEMTNMNQRTKRSPMLSNLERWKVYYALLEKTKNGKLRKKATTEVANMMSIPAQSIHKNTPEGAKVDVSNTKSNCGRKKKEINLAQLLEIPLQQRTTLRSLSFDLEVSLATSHRLLKRGSLHRQSNAIKPYLKDENKKARLEFCLSMVDRSNSRFVDMYNYIHIDEKWFYMTKKKETYYLLLHEENPLRTCQSKNFIGKVMFLVAMARPRFDSEGNELFSGKIGVFPFVNLQQAQRRSRNRNAGTLELKPITSVTREIVKDILISKLIPAIKENWPHSSNEEVIFIQQDNARTHVNPNDVDFQMAASQTGLNIRLVCQPPNSPDLNILDLGLFRAIQALKDKKCSKSVEDLVDAVIESFNNYSSHMANYVWLTLQLCMLETMKSGGSNEYTIPHINKPRLERMGNLPVQISCNPELVMDVINKLSRRRWFSVVVEVKMFSEQTEKIGCLL